MFKIEDNIPIPRKVRGISKEKDNLIETLKCLQDKQSIFVEETILSVNSIVDALKEVRNMFSDRKFLRITQISPIKGSRIWVKFY